MADARNPGEAGPGGPEAGGRAPGVGDEIVQVCGAELSLEAALILGGPGSVTKAYSRLRRGDREAFARIMEYCWQALVRRAGLALPTYLQRSESADGVVTDALVEFWERVDPARMRARSKRRKSAGRKTGRKPSRTWTIRNREDILRLLSTIVVRKALNRIRAARTQKRREDQFRGDSVLADATKFVADVQPGPEEDADFRSLCSEAVAVLPEEGGLRDVGRAWLTTGGSPEEIRAALGLKMQASIVKLKLDSVFAIWQERLPLLETRHEPSVRREVP